MRLLLGSSPKLASLAINLRGRCFSPTTMTLRTTTTASVKVSTSAMPTPCHVYASSEDDRRYRGLTLSNGLKVLLVEDTSTDKSAVAMDVHVGSMSDPWELPGLAHFLEHMLFMGTEKYRDENEYSRYLSEHGGSSNAYTASDHTNFHFDVSPDHLDGAIDRFARFFVEPLLMAGAMEREMCAVNSEHEKNAQSDSWRINQMEKHLAKDTHDFHKFATGNHQTLMIEANEKKLDVRQELLNFHKHYYVANMMGLCVLDKRPLDQIEQLVRSMFNDVRGDESIAPQEWLDHPYDGTNAAKVTFVVPVKDLRSLTLSFPIPDMQEHYSSRPERYLSHLIGHEGRGSLLSELKKADWSSSLVAGERSGAKGFAFFMISVDLTETGIDNWEQVVKLIFQYINMLRSEGTQQWVFEECSKLSEMNFKFRDKIRPDTYVTHLASRLHEYPLEEAVRGGYHLTDFRPDLIQELLQLLTPEKAYISVVGKKFSELADKEEPWYGTKYALHDIPKEQLEEWCSKDFGDSSLAMPEKNDFIADNFDIVAKTKNSNNKETMVPSVLRDTEKMRLWHLMDSEFFRPKTIQNYVIWTPLAYQDPHYANATHLFVQLFNDSLNEFAYPAEIAGLHYGLVNTKYGLMISLRGYNQRQPLLLKKIVEHLKTFGKIDRKRFEVLKENYERALKNFPMEQPYQHVVYYSSALLTERTWLKNQLLAELPNLSADFIEQTYMRNVFSKVFIEGFVHGNVDADEAEKMADTVLGAFHESGSLHKAQLVKDRQHELKLGSKSVFTTSNAVHKSCAVEIYLQTGIQNLKDNMCLELLAQICQEPFFDVLRTKEQLGYVVFSGCRRSPENGAQGLRLLVQSDRFDPCHVDERIEAFILSLGQRLQDMSPEDFEKHKKALRNRRLEKPKSLSQRNAKLWSEVTSGQHHFDRDRIETDFLENQVTLNDIKSLYNEAIRAEGEKRRKLSTHVESCSASQSSQNAIDGGQTVIGDVVEFKKTLALLPFAQPFAKVADFITPKSNTV